MTTPDRWLDPLALTRLRAELSELPERKLHLLTAGALRRVWDYLPSHHTRLAVQATEQFADRRITADQLAQVRSADLLESCDAIWLVPDTSWDDEGLTGGGCGCASCDARAEEYVCRVTTSGGSFAGVRSGVEEPTEIAIQALLRCREIAGWKAAADRREEAEREEGRAQYELLQELLGPQHVNARWPRWRTSDVRALARGIHADRAFDRMPILADALQDAGCDSEAVLRHCREDTEHARGCWVVDLALGFA